MARTQVIRLLVGVLVVTAVAAALVANPPGGRGDQDVERLRSGAATDEVADDLLPDAGIVHLESTTTSLLDATTSTWGVSPATSARAPAPSAAAPTTTRPAVPTTTETPGPPPPTLDPGDPVCSPPPEGGLIRGAVVAVSMPDGIHELSLDGKRDVLILGSTGSGSWGPASWSADGRRLALTRPSESRQDRIRYPAQDLYTIDLERSCTRLLTRSGSDSFMSPNWAPDGSWLSFVRRSGSMASAPTALESAREDGSDVRRRASGTNVMGGSWARDGSGRLAFGREGGLNVIDRDDKITVVDNTTGGAEFESWSPDSMHLLYTVSVHQGIWIAAADGSGVRNLAPTGTRQPAGIYWSRWSPDGRSIVYAKRQELWVVDVDGNNRRRIVEKAGYSGGWFTPAGAELVYTGDGGVFVVPIDGSAPPRLLVAGATALTVFHRG